MFEQKGVVEVSLAPVETGRKRRSDTVAIQEDELLEAFLDGGADTYELIEAEQGAAAEALTEASNLETLSQTLKEKQYAVSRIELRWIPNNTLEVTDPDQARSLLKLMDALEDLDDVQSVTANFEMTDELMSFSVA
jgi:transcriptional/translational regulatory protein YebC/TACO1